MAGFLNHPNEDVACAAVRLIARHGIKKAAMRSRHAQVLSGLQPGDRVILHPADAIADGVAITPRPAED